MLIVSFFAEWKIVNVILLVLRRAKEFHVFALKLVQIEVLFFLIKRRQITESITLIIDSRDTIKGTKPDIDYVQFYHV